MQCLVIPLDDDDDLIERVTFHFFLSGNILWEKLRIMEGHLRVCHFEWPIYLRLSSPLFHN